MSKKQAQVSQDDKNAELGARAFETGMEELTGEITPEEAAKEFAELNQEARAAGLPECDPQQMAANFDPNADADDDGDSDGDDGLGD